MKEGWKLDPQFRQEYIDACREAATNDEAYATFREHDRISTVIENTPMWWAERAMKEMGWSGTTIRYIYTYGLIRKLIGTLGEKDIVEIGGGYGGQCKVIQERCCPHSYTIFDLPEVQKLQQRFLSGASTSIFFANGVKPAINTYDLLISWCAWGELEYGMKKEYLDKVISKAKHFFICSNYTPEEDKKLLEQYFPVVNEFENELVSNVLYF